MPQTALKSAMELFKIVFKNEGMAGIIIFVFLGIFVFHTYITYKLMQNMENIVVLNEYRITLLEEEVFKKPP